MLFDEMLDDSELLTDDDKAALDAEEHGYEPEPQAAPGAIERTRDLENQLAAERERVARLDERRIAAEEASAPRRPQQPQEPPSQLGPKPDDYLDPIGAELWDVRRESELIRMRLDEQQRTAEMNEFSRWVDNDAASFKAQHPDYQAAVDHAYRFRLNHWIGLGLAEQHARAIVDQEALATARLARQNGKSPASQFYALAKQVGYQPGATRGQPQNRPRQVSAPRGTPQPRTRRVTALDLDTMGESELERALRSNPKAVTHALESLELGRG
jgi:hypothetical protein